MCKQCEEMTKLLGPPANIYVVLAVAILFLTNHCVCLAWCEHVNFKGPAFVVKRTSFSDDSRTEVAVPLHSTSLGRVSGRESREPVRFDRSGSLSNASAFAFVHISKCGGESFIKWAHQSTNVRPDGTPTLPRFTPQRAHGTETGNLFDVEAHPNSTRLVFLRSPRSHVMSMFKECRYDKWGKHLIKKREKGGKRTVPHHRSHMEDFMAWVDYFVARNDSYGVT